MKWPGRFSWLVLLSAGLICRGPAAEAQQTSKDKRPPLEMSKAVACQRIDAYEQFTVLPNASLTSEDKLQVYYRPLEYKVVPVEKPRPGYRYRAKFSQDGRIRKKGEKTVLMKKDKILEYDPSFDDPTERIYLVNNVGLKGLAPGDYEYDIILRDDLTEGASATQTLSFTIVPVAKFDPPKTEEPAEPAGSTGSRTGSKTIKKTSKKTGSL
jgi:hypothetical protein